MHGIDLDPEQKHKLLYCKMLAVLCPTVVLSDSKLKAGRCCVIANHLVSMPTNKGKNVE